MSRFVWFTTFTIILTFGIVDATKCEKHITADIPRYASDKSFGKLYTLSAGGNLRTCKWIFSPPINFVLNIFFINATVSGFQAGHICGNANTNFITIRKVDNDNSTVDTLQPYCGERELNGIRIMGTVEIELHYNEIALNGNGLSLAVMYEASLKECGGIYNSSKKTIPISTAFPKSVMTSTYFVHCVWYFELKDLQSLTAAISLSTIYKTYGYCSSKKDFLLLRSWNATTGKTLQEIFECKLYSDRLPVIHVLEENRRFSITIHGEYRWKDKNVEAVCLFSSKELTQTSFSTESNGNLTFNLASVKDPQSSTVNGLILAKMKQKQLVYNVILSAISLICQFGSLDFWTLQNNIFTKNSTLCHQMRDSEVAFFRFKRIFILTLTAKPFHVKNLQVIYFEHSTGCGESLFLSGGERVEVTSPNYGVSNYPNNKNCYWVIIADKTTRLNISVLDMQLETHSNCKYDYVEVYENYRQNMFKRSRMCGTADVSTFTIHGDATINFHSDSGISESGFKILVETFKVCGGAFHMIPDQKIAVTSPNYMHGSYPSFSSCEWKILANESTVLNISVIYMDLEDCKYAFYDYVRIYRGIDQNRTMITEFCKKPSNDIFITGNATILFKSDGTISKSGFLIAVNAARVIKTTTTKLPTTSLTTSKGSHRQSTECCHTDIGSTSLTITNKVVTVPSNNTIVKKDEQKSSNVTAYVAGSVVSVVLVAVGILVFVFLRRRRSSSTIEKSSALSDGSSSTKEANNAAYTKRISSYPDPTSLPIHNPTYASEINQEVIVMASDNVYYKSGDEYAVPDKGRGLSSNGHIYENEANDQPEYTYVANSNCIKDTAFDTKVQSSTYESPDVYDHLHARNNRDVTLDHNVKASTYESPDVYDHLHASNNRDGTLDQDRNAAEYHCPDVYDHLDSSRTRKISNLQKAARMEAENPYYASDIQLSQDAQADVYDHIQRQ